MLRHLLGHARPGGLHVPLLGDNAHGGDQLAGAAPADGEALCGEPPVLITERDVPRTPVLLIPGIGGTLLDVRSSDSKVPDDRVWIRLWEADYTFRTKFWSKWNEATGEVECLDPSLTVVVPEGRAGLLAVDSLDPDLRVRVDDLVYYHDIINVLGSWGYQEGVTLFGFGYDFRQSNRLPRHLDLLEERLADIYDKSGGRKIDVVTHSMGGLFLKCFLVLRRAAFEKYINKWVALTAPWQGAPGYVIDALITGVQFTDGWRRELFVAKWSVHQLVMEMPSLHEMRASPFFDWPELPTLNVWMVPDSEDDDVDAAEADRVAGTQEGVPTGEVCKVEEQLVVGLEVVGDAGVVTMTEERLQSVEVHAPSASTLPREITVSEVAGDHAREGGAYQGLHERHHRLHGWWPHWPGRRKQKDSNAVLKTHTPENMTDVLAEALADNHVTFQGKKVPLPLNQGISAYAFETQRILTGAQLPLGFKFYNVYGVGHRTPFHVCFGSEKKPLHSASDMLLEQATYVNHDGDGTVPVESAMADDMEATERIAVVAEHREILRSPETLAILRRVLDVPPDAPSLVPALPQASADEMVVAAAIAAAQRRRPAHRAPVTVAAALATHAAPPLPRGSAASSPTCCSALS